MKGKFITFEGGEGSGKSTQADLLYKALNEAGIKTIKTREPGGSPAAEKIRELLVTGEPGSLNPVTETLLNFAARSEHLEKTIKPALYSGSYVICDRFVDSSIAYQGYGHGLGPEYIKFFEKLVCGNLQPDLTFLLNISHAEGLQRAGKRGEAENRFEKMGGDFHGKLGAAFLEIAKNNPSRFVVIDAGGSIAAIAEKIRLAAISRLGIKL